MPTPPPSRRPSRAPRRGSAASSIVASTCRPGRSASASSRRPSTSFVPSSRTTNGTVGLTCSNASMRPLATSSQRVMPPKMLNRTALTFVVGQDHLDRRDDRVGLRAAAGVEEVRGRAADLGDDVERRHHEPGAVAEDADVAVELDVGQPALLGHLLLRVLGATGCAAPRSPGWRNSALPSSVTFASSARQLALGRDDQRVDLDEHRVLGHERVVELGQHRADRADRRPPGCRRRRPGAGRGSPGSRAAGRRAASRSPSGSSSATASMSMPPLRREHARAAPWPRGRRRSSVVLGLDLARPPRSRPRGRSARGCPCRGSRSRARAPRPCPSRP